MKVDWDVETDGGFALYPRGIYKVKVNEITEVEAKSGNMQLRIKTDIVDGDFSGSKLTEHITLLPSCGWKLVKFFKAMGMDVKTLPKMDTESGEFRNLLNKVIGRTTYWNVDVIKNQSGDKDINDVVDYKEDTDASWNNPVDEPAFLKD